MFYHLCLLLLYHLFNLLLRLLPDQLFLYFFQPVASEFSHLAVLVANQ